MPQAGDTARVTIRESPSGEFKVISLRPHPVNHAVTYNQLGDEIWTNIARVWQDGDSGPNGRCTLCPQCTARGGLCQVSVNWFVPRRSAPLFSLREAGAVEVFPVV